MATRAIRVVVEDRPIGDALDEYIHVKSGPMGRWKPKTIVDNENSLRRLVKHLGAGTLLSAITPKTIERVLSDENGPLGGGKSNNTIAGYIGHYRSFFKYCLASGWMIRDPMLLVEAPTTSERQDRLFLTADEIWKVIDAATFPTHRILMILQASSGLRISEVQGSILGNVDLDEGYFRAPIFKSTKKGERTRMAEKDITKQLDEELRLWLPMYAEKMGRPLRPEWPLIPTIRFAWSHDDVAGRVRNWSIRASKAEGRVGEPMPLRSGSHVVKTYLLACGFVSAGDYEASHTLRRSSARLFYDAACDNLGHDRALEATARYLNHSDLGTTQRYLGVGPGRRIMREQLRGQDFLRRSPQVDEVGLRRSAVRHGG
jgi:integrase